MDKRPAKIWGSALVLGIAGQLGALWLLYETGFTKSHGGWALLLAAAPLGVTVAIAWKMTSRLNRERLERIAERLAGHAFKMTTNPSTSERTAFTQLIEQFFPVLDLKTGAEGLEWLAAEPLGGPQALVFEHFYTTGTGKQRLTVYHTVAAWPANHPQIRELGLNGGEWFSMSRHPFMQRKPQHGALRAPEFSDVTKDWSLEGDAGIAVRFLTPATRQILQRSPKHETWFLGAGWIFLSYKSLLDAEALDRFLAHGRSALARPV